MRDFDFKQKNKAISVLLAAIIAAGGSITNPSFAETIQANEVYLKPQDTPTLNYLEGNTLQFPNGTTLDIDDVSSYSLNPTDAAATEANVITKSIYDATTKTLSSQNYEIIIDPYFALSGENSVTTNIINGGTFTTYYDAAGKRLALGSGKTASSLPYTVVSGQSTTSYGGVFTNQGTLQNMIGYYIGNYAKSYGGSVLFNFGGTVNNLGGFFIGNDTAGSFGGAILNYSGQIDNITGYFLGNSNSSYGGAISICASGNVDNIVADFIGNKGANAGAIFVYQDSTVGSIVGDFIGNTATSSGGALYLANSSHVGNIVGDFIGNKASSGSAIFLTSSSTIDNITGDFISNSGSAIYNYNKSSIGNISGTFSKNSGNSIYCYYQSSIDSIKADFLDHTYTAIENSMDSTIKKIEGNFVNNKSGGTAAILNSLSRIEEINANFINNSSNVNGGAIYNGAIVAFGGPSATMYPYIGKINGTFIGNSSGKEGETIGDKSGGAISNAGTIDEISGFFQNNCAIGNYSTGGAISSGDVIGKIINSTFIDNYAKSTTENSYSRGGAIYSSEDINLEANDGFDFKFEGNYVQTLDGDKDYQAIYITRRANYVLDESDPENPQSVFSHYSPNTLSLNAIEDAKFTFKDGIAGFADYAKLNINSDDNTGIFDFYRYIDGFDITVNNGTVNLLYSDNVITDYTQNSLNIISGAVNLTLDIKGSDSTFDTITTKGASNGTITIQDINFIDSASANSTLTHKILNTNEGLELALTKNKYITGSTSRTISAEVSADIDVYSNDQIKLRAQSGDVYNKVVLATQDTTNDSLEITYGLVDYNGTPTDLSSSAGDTLYLWNTTNSGSTKNFNFTSTNQTYNVLSDIGTSTEGSLNINGISGAVIDLNGKNGFALDNATSLNLNDVKLTGNTNVISVSNSNANINLNNAVLDGNINSTVNYDLGLQGNTTINGTVNNANALLTGTDSVLMLGNNTFANASLNAQEGTIDLSNDNAISNTNIYSLNSDANVNYIINIDANSQQADKIIISDPNSSGTVTISDISWLSDLDLYAPAGNDWKVDILSKPVGSSVVLALEHDLLVPEYLMSVETQVEQHFHHTASTDSDVLTTDKFYGDSYIHTMQISHFGNLAVDEGSVKLVETSTTSLLLTSIDDTVLTKPELSTLKLIAQSNEHLNRKFSFVSSNETYNSIEDIGAVATGSFTIEGFSDASSVIDLQELQGFQLSNPDTVLNIKNVTLTGNSNDVIRVSDPSAVINIENSVIDGQIISTGVNFDLNIKGNTSFNDLVERANATLTGDESILKLSPHAFRVTSLDAQQGTINLSHDNTTTDTIIRSLNSNSNVKYTIDVDLANGTADTISSSNGSGIVTISDINFINPSSEIKTIQILNNNGSDLVLALDSNINANKQTTYVGNVIFSETANYTEKANEKVASSVSWSDTIKDNVYFDRVTVDKYYTNTVALADTESIQIGEYSYKNYVPSKEFVSGVDRDVLAALAQKVTSDDRSFTTVTENDKYTVTENIDTVTAGTLSINGASGAVIETAKTASLSITQPH